MMKIKLNTLVTTLALAVPVTFLFGGKTALAGDNYVAIAYSQSTGASAYSRNYATRTATSRAARTECKRYAGTDDCQTLVTGRNTCVAFAKASNRGYGWARNSSNLRAQVNALVECSKNGRYCKVIHAVCAK